MIGKIKKLTKIYGLKGATDLTLDMITKGDPRNKADDFNRDFVLNYDPSKKYKVTEGIKNKRISWIIPSFWISSGGHTTIFRIANYLQSKGYKNAFYVIPPYPWPSEKYGLEILKRFYDDVIDMEKIEFNLLKKDDTIADSEYLIVTQWDTAYYGASIENVSRKIYFVQDFEPYFFSHNSDYLFAEQSYKMGYEFIAASPWLHKKLTEEYGMVGDFINLGVEKDQYKPVRSFAERERAVCFYARKVTERRGVELGILALKVLSQIDPSIKIYLFGNENNPAPDLNAENLGILSSHDLNNLYNRVQLGMVFSLTNYSLIPQEMNAASLPVLDISLESNKINYENRGGVLLSEPNAHKIAEKIKYLFSDLGSLSRYSEIGLKDMTHLDWENSFNKFEVLLNSKNEE